MHRYICVYAKSISIFIKLLIVRAELSFNTVPDVNQQLFNQC